MREMAFSLRTVFNRGRLRFGDYSTIFNGNVQSLAKAVVCPLDAEDVSKWVIYLLPADDQTV